MENRTAAARETGPGAVDAPIQADATAEARAAATSAIRARLLLLIRQTSDSCEYVESRPFRH
jgi:hypothetical protein